MTPLFGSPPPSESCADNEGEQKMRCREQDSAHFVIVICLCVSAYTSVCLSAKKLT